MALYFEVNKTICYEILKYIDIHNIKWNNTINYIYVIEIYLSLFRSSQLTSAFLVGTEQYIVEYLNINIYIILSMDMYSLVSFFFNHIIVSQQCVLKNIYKL